MSVGVCPGAGYFLLNRRPLGIAVAGVSILLLMAAFMDIVWRGKNLFAQVEQGMVPLNWSALIEQAMATPSLLSATMLKASMIVFLLLWVWSVIDAWRIGKNMENKGKAST